MSVITICPSDSIQEALDSFNPNQKSVLRLLPGVYEEGKEMEDYRTELNIFELLRKNTP